MRLIKLSALMVLAVTLTMLIACVTPGDSAERSLPDLTGTRYDDAFTAATGAMPRMGTIIKADKDHGLLYGQTQSGVRLDIDIRFQNAQATELDVKGWIPPGERGVGAIDEPDQFLSLYQRIRVGQATP